MWQPAASNILSTWVDMKEFIDYEMWLCQAFGHFREIGLYVGREDLIWKSGYRYFAWLHFKETGLYVGREDLIWKSGYGTCLAL